ncbi:PREDICTED: serine/arginine repetitive matrix protein 1-like [Chinchilla lanigera]|uniref:serine/arginine repetitive matrix protein 1-like n=1 Tax=Chinchilla lanigera TaxID=34839 RepID=UPI0006968FD3|nr:PREDICTED: serine/arginine repetitive matrix protein 1-like [Chinchilla lanigera]
MRGTEEQAEKDKEVELYAKEAAQTGEVGQQVERVEGVGQKAQETEEVEPVDMVEEELESQRDIIKRIRRGIRMIENKAGIPGARSDSPLRIDVDRCWTKAVSSKCRGKRNRKGGSSPAGAQMRGEPAVFTSLRTVGPQAEHGGARRRRQPTALRGRGSPLRPDPRRRRTRPKLPPPHEETSPLPRHDAPASPQAGVSSAPEVRARDPETAAGGARPPEDPRSPHSAGVARRQAPDSPARRAAQPPPCRHRLCGTRVRESRPGKVPPEPRAPETPAARPGPRPDVYAPPAPEAVAGEGAGPGRGGRGRGGRMFTGRLPRKWRRGTGAGRRRRLSGRRRGGGWVPGS